METTLVEKTLKSKTFINLCDTFQKYQEQFSFYRKVEIERTLFLQNILGAFAKKAETITALISKCDDFIWKTLKPWTEDIEKI